MSQKRTHKQYTKEFKEEAVALILEQSYSVEQAAESLSIGISLFYKWKEKLEPSVMVWCCLKTSVMSLSACVERTKNCEWRKRS